MQIDRVYLNALSLPECWRLRNAGNEQQLFCMMHESPARKGEEGVCMHEANISYYSTGAAFATSTQAVQDQMAYRGRIYPHNAATLSQLLKLH